MNTLTINSIREHNKRAGGTWFDPGWMRWFNTTLSRNVYPTPTGGLFVASSRMDYSHPLAWTIHAYDAATGEVSTVGEFRQYASRSGAHKAARRLAGDAWAFRRVIEALPATPDSAFTGLA